MWLIYYFCTRITASLLRHNCCRLEELIINAINSNKNEVCPTYIKPLCYFVSNPNLESIWNFNFRFFPSKLRKALPQEKIPKAKSFCQPLQNWFAKVWAKTQFPGSAKSVVDLWRHAGSQMAVPAVELQASCKSFVHTRNIKFVNRSYHC